MIKTVIVYLFDELNTIGKEVTKYTYANPLLV